MRILVAGIGNIFFGDDAFGVEVVRELLRREWPAEVRIEDFGIRSYDLAYAIVDGYDAVILVDATPRGHAPGTVSLIEPDLAALEPDTGEVVNAHSLNPVRVLQMVRSLGGQAQRLYLVGCEPAVLETEELGLSATVRAAVPRAVELVESLVGALRNGTPVALLGDEASCGNASGPSLSFDLGRAIRRFEVCFKLRPPQKNSRKICGHTRAGRRFFTAKGRYHPVAGLWPKFKSQLKGAPLCR